MSSLWTKLAVLPLLWTALASPALAAGEASEAAALAAPAASLGPLIHVNQTLNNCGPASVAEVLDYWGIEKSQSELSGMLRHGNSAGMSTDDVASYVQSIGLNEFIGSDGSDQVIKSLVANGLPVIVAQLVSSSDDYPHFRPIEGYDDRAQVFVSSDPLLGDGYQLSYPEFDRLWLSSDRVFLVIFPESMRATLMNALNLVGFNGPSWVSPGPADTMA